MLIKLDKKAKLTLYEKFCVMSQYYSHQLPKDFFLSLEEGKFKLSFDKANFTDITLCVEGLKLLPCVSVLQLEGSAGQIAKKQIKSVRGSSLSKTMKNPNESRLANLHSKYNLSKLLDGLSLNFQNKGSLLTLKLLNFHFDIKSWELVNQCLKLVSSLKEIQISSCSLKDEDLSILSNGINLQDLSKIDLSHNLLENDGCDIISRVISRVNSNQVELEWSHGLRNGLPAPQLGGLREVNLSHNKINDKGLINLTHGLFYDDFVKVLNLGYNLLTCSGYKEINNLLQTNSALIMINLEQNEKTSDMAIVSQITDKLWQNFQINAWVVDEGKWIEQVEGLKKVLTHSSTSSRAKGEAKSKSKVKVKVKRIGLGSEHKGLHERDEKKLMASCDKCELFERELFKSKSQCVNLQLRNNLLMKKLDSAKSRKN